MPCPNSISINTKNMILRHVKEKSSRSIRLIAYLVRRGVICLLGTSLVLAVAREKADKQEIESPPETSSFLLQRDFPSEAFITSRRVYPKPPLPPLPRAGGK